MSVASICVLYTQDADLARRVKAFLRAMALVRHVNDPNRMEAVLQQNSPAVILMDLRAKECRDLLEQLEQDWPESLVIALGAPRSEPLRGPNNPTFMRRKICNSTVTVFKPSSAVPSIT